MPWGLQANAVGVNDPVDPPEVLAVDAVGLEGAADGADDGHPAVAEPAIHVLTFVHASDASPTRRSKIRAVGRARR